MTKQRKVIDKRFQRLPIVISKQDKFNSQRPAISECIHILTPKTIVKALSKEDCKELCNHTLVQSGISYLPKEATCKGDRRI
jgi:hypothetical protein